MAQDQTDEVDLVYVIKKIKQIANRWIALAFKGLDHCLKYWYVILVLALIGLGLGYYKNKNAAISQKSEVLVRVNFEMPNYVYNAVDLLNAKIRDRDSLFLSEIGLKWYNPEIKELKIEAVPNFLDILEKYQMNDRNLDMLLRNVDFEGEETPLKDMFIQEYNFFILDVTLASNGTKETLGTLIDYLNNQGDLDAYKVESFKNLQANIAYNERSLAQIDKILDSYSVSEISSNSSVQSVVEKDWDFTKLLDSKTRLQKETEKLKNELLLSDEIVVPVNSFSLTMAQKGILANKMIVYPIFFVFIFMFLSYSRYVFFYLKRIAKENS